MSPNITLLPAEKLLQQCLLDCREQICPKPELRFSGGWVRDKVLGLQSHDIDVALDNITGFQFGLQLQEYLQSQGTHYEAKAAELGITKALGGLHKIEANPEKSKHLETLTTRLFGLDLDFVNLRKETYSADSRTPQMEFGTAEEDALRRDVTVNALFYNLQTEEVEDFTKMGLNDMRAEVLRTPLEPETTFKDDPLRVLRLVRFASQLGFSIDKRALETMQDPAVHLELRRKISRERVGTEVGKMLSGPDPLGAMKLIVDLGLYATVFADPEGEQIAIDEVSTMRIHNSFQLILNEPRCRILKNLVAREKNLCWWLVVYVPYKDGAAEAAKEAVKATNKVVKLLSDVSKSQKVIHEMVGAGRFSRSVVGMKLYSLGAMWYMHVLYWLLHDLGQESSDSGWNKVMGEYLNFLQSVQSEELSDAAEVKPIINGNEIQKAFDGQKGKWIRDALNMVLEWQFENPEATKEDAITMIKSRRAEMGLR